MKKERKAAIPLRKSVPKIIRIMKLVSLFLLVGFVQVSANIYSQTANISLDLKSASLKEVVKEIQAQTEFTFFYSPEDVEDVRVSSVDVNKASLEKTLDLCLKGTGLKYEIVHKAVILKKEEKPMTALPWDLNIANQQQKVSGKVTDSSGAPLPGVTVVVKGTTKGNITDAEGNYSILKVHENATLSFSFIGMKTQEIPVEGKSLVNVKMEENAIGIDEVVAIGYGTVKRGDLTGSVSSVKGSSFQEQSLYSTENALAGRISGVKVIDAAQPGAGASIQIRGTNSMLGGTEPLYVVDGIPVEPNQDAQGESVGGSQNSSVNFIDPASIDKIEVLKDASATAIYGARGANGVVIITTKKGMSNKQQLTFKYSVNVSQVTHERDVLNGPEFANWLNLQTANNGYLQKSWWSYEQQQFDNGSTASMPITSPWGTSNYGNDLNFRWAFNGVERPLPNSSELANTDWQNEIFRTALTQNYNLGYSGGTDKGNYAFGVNYLDQQGVVVGSSFQRLNANMNITQRINEKLKVSSTANLTKGNSNALMTNNGQPAQNIITKALVFAPTNSPLKEGESYEDFDFNDVNYLDSPIDIATKLIDDKEQINMLGSFNIDYQILKSLSLTATGALTYNANNRDSYWPMTTARGAASNGEATSGRNQFFKSMIQCQLSYNKQFNKDNRIDAVLVHSYEKIQFREDFLLVKNFSSDVLTYKNLASGVDYSVPQNNFYNSVLKSYLGRVNYHFYDKYLLTLSLRTDGSSRFAKNNKWGYFPSGAFAWRLGEENFVRNLNLFSNLKLRLSYGKTGGQAISPYQSLATLITKNYTFDNAIAPGFIENNLENPNLKWETTNQYNVGVDFGFINNRINLTIDAYYKKTRDLLMKVENPPSSGFSTKINNVGAVDNKGIEAELSANILDGQLKWNTIANLSFNRNKVIDMGVNGFQYSSFQINGYNPIIFKEGEPLGSFIGYQHVKIFESWDEVYKSAQKSGASIGDMMYKDQNNDGILNNDDMVIIGNPNPDATWGITNEFKYKSFDLSILIDGQIGGDIYSVDDMTLESNFRLQNATRKAARNSWIPSGGHLVGSWQIADGTSFSTEGYDYGFGNTNAYTASPMFNSVSPERTRVTDEYVRDATFIKLRNISLGYNLNSQFVRAAGIKNLRLYFSGTNLLTITKFDGFDPEVTTFNNDPSRRGIDMGTYPIARTFTFGINATF